MSYYQLFLHFVLQKITWFTSPLMTGPLIIREGPTQNSPFHSSCKVTRLLNETEVKVVFNQLEIEVEIIIKRKNLLVYLLFPLL